MPGEDALPGRSSASNSQLPVPPSWQRTALRGLFHGQAVTSKLSPALSQFERSRSLLSPWHPPLPQRGRYSCLPHLDPTGDRSHNRSQYDATSCTTGLGGRISLLNKNGKCHDSSEYVVHTRHEGSGTIGDTISRSPVRTGLFRSRRASSSMLPHHIALTFSGNVRAGFLLISAAPSVPPDASVPPRRNAPPHADRAVLAGRAGHLGGNCISHPSQCGDERILISGFFVQSAPKSSMWLRQIPRILPMS